MAGATLYYMEDHGVHSHMQDTDQEVMIAYHAISNISSTGQISYLQVIAKLAHTRCSRSTGSRI
jgi:hypothetical protein